MKFFLPFLFLLVQVNLFAQNVAINSAGTAAVASAILDLSANTSKGFLPEQVALTATNAQGPITSPATGLLVYNTATAGTSPTNVVPGYYYWNGAAWVYLINNSKIAIPLPGLLANCTAGVYYNPGFNINKRSTGFDYTSNVLVPGSLDYYSAYEGDNNYVMTSAGNFSRVYGWLNAATAGTTVTVYVYLYSPVDNSAVNIAGVSLGSQVISITVAKANYAYEITANTALAKGQFLRVWFVPSATMSVFTIGTLELTYTPQ